MTLPNAVLQTAQWMAKTYLCGLAVAVRCVIPDAQAAHIVRRIALTDGWEAALPDVTTPSHRQVVIALASFPKWAATEEELSQVVGGAKVTSPITILRKRGLLKDTWTVEPPRTGAKKVKVVRLLVVWDEAEAEAVKREAKAATQSQARLLRSLASVGGGPLPLSEAIAMAQSTPTAVKRLEADGLVETATEEVRRRPFRFVAGAAVPPMPTDEQKTAVEAITARLESRQSNVALLYGVTASGKTEVYLRAIAETRRRKRTALVLVPEIALTNQVVDTFRARIGDKVAVLHSALSEGERRDEWQRIDAARRTWWSGRVRRSSRRWIMLA